MSSNGNPRKRRITDFFKKPSTNNVPDNANTASEDGERVITAVDVDNDSELSPIESHDKTNTESSATSMPPSDTEYARPENESNTDVSSKKAKYEHHFQEKWRKDNSWLRKSDSGGMLCQICSTANKKNKFTSVEGSFNFRTSTLERHIKSKDHINALKEEGLRLRFRTTSSTAINKNYESLICSMRTVYWLCKEDIALRKYPSLINFCTLQGCQPLSTLGSGKNATYQSRATAEEFTETFAEIIQKDIVDKINTSDWFSVLMDESTDISVSKKMVVYVRIMTDEFNPETYFLGNLTITETKATAEILFNHLKNYLTEKGIDLKKAVGFGSDGASVMMGAKSGVATRVQEISPHCISIHCVAHRLNLCTSQAAHQVTYLKETFERCLTDMFYYFSKSGNRTAELKQIQGILECDHLKVREVHEIRWLAFYDALYAVHRSWRALVQYFKDHKKDSKVTSGLFDKLRDFKFIATAHMLMDVIPALAQLSLVFQKRDLDVAAISPALSAVKDSIKKARTGKTHYQRELREGLKFSEDESEKKVVFQGHNVSFSHSDHKKSYKEFEEIRTSFLDNLDNNLKKRFPPESTSITKCFEVLGLRALSFMSADERDTYGNEEIKRLSDFYGKEAKKKDTICEAKLDGNACVREWGLAKRIILEQMYPRDRLATLWQLVYTHHRETFPNLLKLCKIGLLLPMQTAECERGFSAQNRIKSSSRNRLETKMLQNLMAVTIEGPPLDQFDFSKAVTHWKNKKDRRAFKQ